jgi:hypothetical protein
MPNIRFDKYHIFNGDTKVMGATVSEWDKALTGNMQDTLLKVKELAKNSVKRDLTKATTFDVASAASKLLNKSKR